MDSKNLYYLMGLNALNFTVQQIEVLRSQFRGNLEEAWEYLSQKETWQDQNLKWVDRELEVVLKKKIDLVSFWDERYPKALKEIFQAPPLLYVRGRMPSAPLALAVVGSRKASAYGLEVTQGLCAELTHHSVLIVSGMALGIDAQAHRSTLQAGGMTIGVLGNGFHYVYPKEHQKLYDEVAEKGALVTEFSYDRLPLAHHFPRRNRILAGLTQGVVVVEALRKSGALITARFALENNRDVFCIPGRLDSALSQGPHQLIQQGAKLISCAQDILDEFHIRLEHSFLTQVPKIVQSLSMEQKELLDHLDHPKDFETLLSELHLPVDALSKLLVIAEMDGIIGHSAGQYFRRLSWQLH
ncbi:MAG: DNA-protecting protein DprA [Deltaproteobacteria bacterium]|nr:DNA-protecting protein DprA [Deltaproteobacteria bacterium]